MNKPILYNYEDIQRWQAASGTALIQDCGGVWRINPHIVDQPSGRIWSVASLNCARNARLCIALEEYGRALGWLEASVRAKIRLYRGYANGEGITIEYMAAGNWQALLNAHASTNQAVVDHFCDVFDLELAARPEVDSTKDSLYHGRLLKAITLKQWDAARAILAERRPSVEPMFRGYIACMEAIVNFDRSAFERCIHEASIAWFQYARRCWKGLSDAVCFLYGVGLIRLAEHSWGDRVVIDDPHIPGQLLGDVEVDSIDLVL